MLGKLTTALGTLLFVHCTYSIYEDPSLPIDVILELVLSLILLVTAVLSLATPLKPIAWNTHMNSSRIDDVDSRPSFAAFNHRGTVLYAAAPTSTNK